MARKQEPKPDFTAKVFLVGHGYEIGFFGPDNEELGFECRDFSGDFSDKELEKVKNLVMAGMMDLMGKVEKLYNKHKDKL